MHKFVASTLAKRFNFVTMVGGALAGKTDAQRFAVNTNVRRELVLDNKASAFFPLFDEIKSTFAVSMNSYMNAA